MPVVVTVTCHEDGKVDVARSDQQAPPPTDTNPPPPTTTPPPVNPEGKLNVSVFDFGANDDGSTDNSQAFTKALEWANQNGGTVEVPDTGGSYAIAKPVEVALVQQVRKWGLYGSGEILSHLENGEDLITLSQAEGFNRNMTLSGLNIRGSAKDGAGIILRCTGGWWSQNLLQDIVIENMGRDGLVIEGGFFESTISGLRVLDAHSGSGVVLANLGGKNISSIRMYGLNIAQCGQYGVQSIGRDTEYNAPQDTRFIGGYIRQCGKNAMLLRAGGYLTDFSFENNGLGGSDSHVSVFGHFVASGVRGDMSLADANTAYLFDITSASNHLVTLRGCNHHANKWKATTKLAKLRGKNFTYISNCQGTIDYTGTGGYERVGAEAHTQAAA